MRTHIKALILGLTVALAVAGCSVLQTVAKDENRLAVRYATAKILERSDVSPTYVMNRIGEAKRYVSEGADVSVGNLVNEARERLRGSSLMPADQILIEAILARAEERLKARIGDGRLSADQRVQLLTVLDWIEVTARGYPTQ